MTQVGTEEDSHLLSSSLLSLIPPGSAMNVPNRSRGPSWYSEWSESRSRACSSLLPNGHGSQTELIRRHTGDTDPSPKSPARSPLSDNQAHASKGPSKV